MRYFKILIFVVLFVLLRNFLGYLLPSILPEDSLSKAIVNITIIEILTLILVLILYIKYGNSKEQNQKVSIKYVFIIILVIFLFKIIFSLVYYYEYILSNKSLESYIDSDVSTSIYFFNLIRFSIIIPIYEELFFRGVLLDNLLQRKKAFFAIIFVSFLFTIVHLDFNTSTINIENLISLFLSSIIFSYLFYLDRNILYPIIAHISYNLLNHIFFKKEFFHNILEYLEFGALYWLLIALSLLLFVYIVMVFHKAKEK